MGKTKSSLTKGLSGKFGELTFQQRRGKTIAGRSQDERTKGPSAAQQKVLDRFREASRYAKAALANPQKRAFYESIVKPGMSARSMAMTDYLRKPQVSDIDYAEYDGSIGSVILFKAVEESQMTVKVRIERADGSLVEEGLAAMDEAEIHWIYTATMVNASVAGSRIIILAKDLPGNSTKAIETIQ